MAGLPALRVEGPGRPWVLLHGFGQTAQAWDHVLAARGEAVAAVALTLPGHADAPPAPATFEATVDKLAEALTELSADPLPVLGYSLGGRLALGLACRHPSRIARAIVVGAHPGLADPAARAERAALDDAWAQRLEQEGVVAFFRAWRAQPLFASQASAPPERRAARAAAEARHDPRRLAGAMRALSLGRMPLWTPALAAGTVPLTYLVGALDAKFTAVAGELAREVPRLDVRGVPGVGHDVTLEAPEALAGFLG
ncbi:MAG: alpha/beta fold hydrolase [Deltaproteobacteria bacterium]|nr:alpha/beta fold hydrolase [Deltaproteobacteria bacterium]